MLNFPGKTHTKCWLPFETIGDLMDADSGLYEQVLHLSELPFAHHHLALMPDAHQGFGMPIGGVAAFDGVVSPHCVGADIGCGMYAWKTGITVEEFMTRRESVHHQVFDAIPVGKTWHKSSRDSWLLRHAVPDIKVLKDEIPRAKLQLGTLGSGNHFIEFQKDENGYIWVMIHSGSRNLGKKMCDYYNDRAVEMNNAFYSEVPAKWGLAFLPVDTAIGQEYLEVMEFCLTFAAENRQQMADAIEYILVREFGAIEYTEDPIDVHHNYASLEHHFGKNVWVHRKGAVRAIGNVIIPGSMGSSSYIGEGLKNPFSFHSCSHGAGRPMSRTDAKKCISVEDYTQEMAEADIALLTPSANVADESRAAYKDIEDVMANQTDLVKPLVKLTPVAVVKG